LAKRLRGLVNGVKFVVVEETDPLPEQLSRHQEAWGNDNSRARGVYFENTATGEKIIYVRGSSAGDFQGINNTTVLHELLHAATQQKLLANLGKTPILRLMLQRNNVISQRAAHCETTTFPNPPSSRSFQTC
jgi:hypothetical protein